MRWVKLTIDDSEMREKMPFSETKAHLVWVLVDASYISNEEE